LLIDPNYTRKVDILQTNDSAGVRDIKVKNEDLLFGDMWTVRM
jgi:hypothetical protein